VSSTAKLDLGTISQRAIEAARKATAAIPREVPALPDLLVAGYDAEPTFWYIHVEPLTPSNKIGSLYAPDETVEAERYKTNIGRVLKVGPAAMKGHTSSGIPLSDFLPGITEASQMIGRYFVYNRNAGQVITLRETKQQILITEITDLVSETSKPDAWKFYL